MCKVRFAPFLSGTHIKATRGRREENTNTVPSETERPEALDHKIGGGANKSTEVQRRCGKTRREDVCGYRYQEKNGQVQIF